MSLVLQVHELIKQKNEHATADMIKIDRRGANMQATGYTTGVTSKG